MTRARRPIVSSGADTRFLIVVAVLVADALLALSSGPTGIAGMAWFLVPLLGLVAVGAWLGVGLHSLVQRQLALGVIIAPLLGLLTAGLVVTGTTPVLRFALVDRLAFELIVARAPDPVITLPEHDLSDDESYATMTDFPGPCPAFIGTLAIRECDTFAAGYLFYDWAGSGFIDDGGIAYMPKGVPSHDVGNGSFESPQFRHLVGPWYSFASSW